MDRLDSIAVFVTVAERRGFIAAARRLGRSPAAVSRAVAALEDELGLRLINRTTRALSLTEAGESLLERGRRLLADYQDIKDALEGGGAAKGVLTVTAPVQFGRLHIMPIVRRFLVDHPGVDINLRLLDHIAPLVDEGIDVALRIGELPDSSLLALRVGAVRRVLVASPAYIAAHGAPMRPEDLENHAFISAFGASVTSNLLTLGPEEDRSFRFRPRLSVNSIDAGLDAAAAGLGIVRLLSYQVEAALAAGRLVRILADFEPPSVPIHLVRPAGRRPSQKVSLFIAEAAAALRGHFDAG